MTTFQFLKKTIANSPYSPANIVAVYDGTLAFRIGDFMWSALLNSADASVALTMEITPDNLAQKGIYIGDSVSEDDLLFLCNLINSDLPAVRMACVKDSDGLYFTIGETLNFSSRKDIERLVISHIARLQIVADCFFSIAKDCPLDYDNSYETYLNSVYNYILNNSGPLSLLIVSDFRASSSKQLIKNLKDNIPQWNISEFMISANPVDDLKRLNALVGEGNINIVVGIEHGCILTRCLNDFPKLLLNPHFHTSRKKAYAAFEKDQFKKITAKDEENTQAIAWSEKSDEKSIEEYIKYYGPISIYSSLSFWKSKKIACYAIIPLIASLCRR